MGYLRGCPTLRCAMQRQWYALAGYRGRKASARLFVAELEVRVFGGARSMVERTGRGDLLSVTRQTGESISYHLVQANQLLFANKHRTTAARSCRLGRATARVRRGRSRVVEVESCTSSSLPHRLPRRMSDMVVIVRLSHPIPGARPLLAPSTPRHHATSKRDIVSVAWPGTRPSQQPGAQAFARRGKWRQLRAGRRPPILPYPPKAVDHPKITGQAV